MIVWLNGDLLPVETARIDPRDRGLLLGDGLFETVRVRGGRARLWPRHADRLAEGARVLGLPLPDHDLCAAIEATARANYLAEAAARLTLTRGVGARGIAPPEPCQPTLLITAAPYVAAPAAGVRLCVAESVRRNERSPLSRLKTLNYLEGVLARREATERGFDDAVMLNLSGRVAEATAANLFARFGDRWLTPPVAEGALPGVVRAELLARGFGAEDVLTPQRLEAADEIILANSLGITGVCTLNFRALAEGEGTRAARALYEAF